MIDGYKTFTVPGKHKTLPAPSSAFIVEIGLAPLLIGQPAFPVLEPVAADAAASEGVYGPQVFTGLPSPRAGGFFIDEFRGQAFVVRAVEIAENINQFPLINP